jgi:hypothetical protein
MIGGERIMRWKKGKRNMTWGKWQPREECWDENLVGGDRWEKGQGKGMGQDGAEWKTHGGRWTVEEIRDVTRGGRFNPPILDPPPPY